MMIDLFEKYPIPYILLMVFCLFALTVTLYIELTPSASLNEWMTLKFGWVGIQLYYFVLIGGVVLGITMKKAALSAVRFVLIVMFVYGLVGYLINLSSPAYGNPYLSNGSFRLVCAVLLPLVWLRLMYSQRVKNAFNKS